MSYSALPYFFSPPSLLRGICITQTVAGSQKTARATNRQRTKKEASGCSGLTKTDISTWPISCLSRKHRAEEPTWNGELIQRRVCWGLGAVGSEHQRQHLPAASGVNWRNNYVWRSLHPNSAGPQQSTRTPQKLSFMQRLYSTIQAYTIHDTPHSI